MNQRTCEHPDCGNTWQHTGRGRPRLYCSATCKTTDQHRVRPTKPKGRSRRRCADCGVLRPISKHSRPEGKYRCNYCRRKSRSESQERRSLRLVQHRVRPTVACKNCGTEFVQSLDRAHCDTCTVNRAWLFGPRPNRRKPPELRAPKHEEFRKRAKRFGVEYEPVNKRRVFDRDGWRCGICGKRVRKTAKWPDLMCPSLDHIVPMSRGGGHTYVNVQCAHWRCNTRKAATGTGDQLALIG